MKKATKKKAAPKRAYNRKKKEEVPAEKLEVPVDNNWEAVHRDTQFFKVHVRETARGIMYQFMNNSPVNRELLFATSQDNNASHANELADSAFALAEAFERAWQNY